MNRKQTIFFLTMLSLSFSLYADVYTLWPFKDRTASLSAYTEFFQPKKFWTERIRVNGRDLELEIFLIDMPLAEIAKKIPSSLDPEIQVLNGANSLLLQEKQNDGSMKRVYFLSLSGIQPVLQFQMVLPPERLIPARQDWPAELPYMENAAEVTCMEFPVRNAVFGAFFLENTTVPQALGNLTSGITASGWEKVSRESDHVFSGSGEVFMKSNPQSIMILGIVKNGDGVRVSMYSRPL